MTVFPAWYVDHGIKSYPSAHLQSLWTRRDVRHLTPFADVRCEGARNYTLVMSFTTALLANHSVPLPLVAAQSRALYNRIFNATVTARITSSYRASINYARHSPPQPAASAAGRPKSRAGDQLPSILAGSIVGGVALAVLLGFAVWRWRSRRGVLRQGSRITAPGLGRDTTLCITDIQVSHNYPTTTPTLPGFHPAQPRFRHASSDTRYCSTPSPSVMQKQPDTPSCR